MGGDRGRAKDHELSEGWQRRAGREKKEQSKVEREIANRFIT